MKSVPCAEHAIGHAVLLTWADEPEIGKDSSHWHSYRIIGVWAATRMLLLEGMDEDGAHFTGPPVWVPVERIYLMEVMN